MILKEAMKIVPQTYDIYVAMVEELGGTPRILREVNNHFIVRNVANKSDWGYLDDKDFHEMYSWTEAPNLVTPWTRIAPLS